MSIIKKELSQLLAAKVINQEAADSISRYFENKSKISSNRIFVIFGILGAILTGLGIILIVAHNWDELPKGVKTFFAFLPIITGQAICGYALFKKPDNGGWKESGSVFLFFAIGAGIALVSQIFHIPGGTGSFLLTWMLLCIPLIYVMNSSVTSLLCIAGTTYYAVYLGYWNYPVEEPYLYWILLLAIMPHYYKLLKVSPESNFTYFHNWIWPISVTITLGTLANNYEILMFVAYMSLFGLYYLIGNSAFFKQQRSWGNGYNILGTLGIISLLMAFSFDWIWQEVRTTEMDLYSMLKSPEFISSVGISIVALVIFYLQVQSKTTSNIRYLSPVFLIFIAIYFIGTTSTVAVVLVNILLLAIGILTIRDGSRQSHLGVLNFGLMIITILVIFRFFDSEMSFILRGLLFVAVGVGFFVTNYLTIQKRSAK